MLFRSPMMSDKIKIIVITIAINLVVKVVFMSMISLMSIIGPASRNDSSEPIVKVLAYASAKKASMLKRQRLGDVAVWVHQNKSFKSLSAAGLRLIGLTSVSSVTLLMDFSSCSPLS